MLNFCDFIHVFVFTRNHHLKGLKCYQICVLLYLPMSRETFVFPIVVCLSVRLSVTMSVLLTDKDFPRTGRYCLYIVDTKTAKCCANVCFRFVMIYFLLKAGAGGGGGSKINKR